MANDTTRDGFMQVAVDGAGKKVDLERIAPSPLDPAGQVEQGADANVLFLQRARLIGEVPALLAELLLEVQFTNQLLRSLLQVMNSESTAGIDPQFYFSPKERP